MRDKKYKKRTDREKANYSKYLKSAKWKKIREQAFEFHGRRCGLCGNETRLQVHHLSYKNIFNETMADLRVICDPCHKSAHRSKWKPKRNESPIYYPERKKHP